MGQQAEPPSQISASEILRKNLIATGGLEAHKALESLVASGDFHLGFTRDDWAITSSPLPLINADYAGPRRTLMRLLPFH